MTRCGRTDPHPCTLGAHAGKPSLWDSWQDSTVATPVHRAVILVLLSLLLLVAGMGEGPR